MFEAVLLCTALAMLITYVQKRDTAVKNSGKSDIMIWNCTASVCFEKRRTDWNLRMKGGILSGRTPGIGVLVCVILLLFVDVRADEPNTSQKKELSKVIEELRDEDKTQVFETDLLKEKVDMQMLELARLRDLVNEMKGLPPRPDPDSISIEGEDPMTEEEKKSWYYYLWPKGRWTHHYQLKNATKEEGTEKCETFKCCSLMVMDTIMDIMWVAITDPINLAGKISEGVGKIVKDQLQVMSGILGTAITFTTLNVMVYVATRFSKIYKEAKRMCGRFCELPVLALGIDILKKASGWASEHKEGPTLEKLLEGRLQSMTEAMEKIKEELKKPTIKKGELLPKCGYCGSSTHVMRDCPVKKYDDQKCHYCGEKGHIAVSCPKRKKDMSQGVKPWKKDPRVKVIVEKGEGSGEEQTVICSYCGELNHTISSCLEKRRNEMKGAPQDLNPFRVNRSCRICGLTNHTESNCFRAMKKTVKTCEYCGGWNHNERECYKKSYDEQQRKKSAEGNVSTVGASSQVPQGEKSGSRNAKEGESSESKKTRVYAPINFEGKRFSKCLIDTGAQANLMPAGDVTRHQFVINKGGITEVRGFNGSPGKILGTVLGELQFGPDKGTKKTEFLVSPDVGEPIIGFPTLRDFGLSINCQSHEIFNESTGEAVLCSVVSSKKN